MSRVTLSQIEEGDALAIAALNADMAALATASTSGASAGIDETNVREEGLDDRSIAVRAITPSDGVAVNNSFSGSSTYTTSDHIGVIVPVQPDGANDLVIGPFAYNRSAGDRIMVRLSFDFDGQLPDGTNLSAWVIQFGYATDYTTPGSGTWTWLSGTVRKVAWHAATSTDGRITGSFTMQHLFTTSMSSTTDLYIGARIYQEDGSTTSEDFTMRRIYFYGKLRAK